MKIRIELDESLEEQEIIIRTPALTEDVTRLQELIRETTGRQKQIEFYKGETRIYISSDEILFFETNDKGICAHTVDDSFEVRHKLYELEEMLPHHFMRVSKSAILNIRKIFAIDRNIASASEVSFRGTHKQVFVSRHYYKALIDRLDERRSNI